MRLSFNCSIINVPLPISMDVLKFPSMFSVPNMKVFDHIGADDTYFTATCNLLSVCWMWDFWWKESAEAGVTDDKVPIGIIGKFLASIVLADELLESIIHGSNENILSNQNLVACLWILHSDGVACIQQWLNDGASFKQPPSELMDVCQQEARVALDMVPLQEFLWIAIQESLLVRHLTTCNA